MTPEQNRITNKSNSTSSIGNNPITIYGGKNHHPKITYTTALTLD
jgi:hypothetical protein